jgi:hypothetical protein
MAMATTNISHCAAGPGRWMLWPLLCLRGKVAPPPKVNTAWHQFGKAAIAAVAMNGNKFKKDRYQVLLVLENSSSRVYQTNS